MRIGGATLNQIPLDWENNITNIIDAITLAKKDGIQILCTPELGVSGYGCEDMFLSDWVARKAWAHLQRVVPHTGNITVAVGLPIRHQQVTYNGACVISNQTILGIALKQNLAKDGVHYEPRWFTPWRAGRTISLGEEYDNVQAGDIIFEAAGIRFGFEICEDAWSKQQRPGYRLKDRDIQLILNPSASHFAMGKSVQREQEVIVDGSRFFQCAYVFTNHLGNEAGRMIYDGDIVIGQHGKLLAINRRLSFKRVNVLACDVDFAAPEKSQVIITDDIKDRNEELAQAAALALFDYMRKTKSRGYVLSLSGGADSSLCAVLVAEMVRRGSAELGWRSFYEALGLPDGELKHDVKETVNKILTCAYQGTVNSSAATLQAAKALAMSIGAEFHAWTIDDEVKSYSAKIERALDRKLTWEKDDIAMQNIQARSRSPIIWMLANIKRSILLTTSNRSEGDVGYATMDGDTSGSLAPIAGLSKPFILQWLKWAEKELGYAGLSYVNNLQPTAELRPQELHQTDEADLMPYTVLTEIERLAIYHKKSPVEVFEEMNGTMETDVLKGYISKFFRLWSANQWKRERLAPSFHFDNLNVDPRSWCRFPIISSSFKEELEELQQHGG